MGSYHRDLGTTFGVPSLLMLLVMVGDENILSSNVGIISMMPSAGHAIASTRVELETRTVEMVNGSRWKTSDRNEAM
ncbi:hypothetical protein Ancab_006706 [Ancistrocladus abbreviatus]